MGRALADRRTTNAVTKNTDYTYNLDGSVASITYPHGDLETGEVVTYKIGAAGRPLSMSEFADGTSAYAYNANYTPHGELCHLKASWGNEFTHRVGIQQPLAARAHPALWHGLGLCGSALHSVG